MTRPPRSIQTSIAMLASRRPATASWLRVRKNGSPERMSATIRAGASSPPSATGAGIRPLPRCDVSVATYLVWQAPESVVGGLLLAGCSEEAGLPATEAAFVAEQEPEHHRDPRVLAGHRVRLGEVLGLLDPGDPEGLVRRAGLVAVLGDPELLVAVELGQELGQITDVRERDRRAVLRLRRWGLRRPAVVRMVRPDIEVAQAEPLHGREECQRGDRRPAALRCVVAARAGGAAGDDLVAEVRRVDARPYRRAHPRIDLRGDRRVPGAVLLRPLRRQEDRVVRLVPGEPFAYGRQNDVVTALERAAVPLGCGEGELLQEEHLPGCAVGALPRPVRPARCAVDREQDLDLVLGGVQEQAVVAIPVVRGIPRVDRMLRALLRDVEPVEVHSDDLRPQVDELGERLIRGVERTVRIEDADEHAASGIGGLRPRRCGEGAEDDE